MCKELTSWSLARDVPIEITSGSEDFAWSTARPRQRCRNPADQKVRDREGGRVARRVTELSPSRAFDGPTRRVLIAVDEVRGRRAEQRTGGDVGGEVAVL